MGALVAGRREPPLLLLLPPAAAAAAAGRQARAFAGYDMYSCDRCKRRKNRVIVQRAPQWMHAASSELRSGFDL